MFQVEKNLLLVLEKDVVSTSSKGFVHQERRQGKEKHRRLLQKDVLVRRRKLCGLNHFVIFNFGNQISSQTTLKLKCDQTWRCGTISNLSISFGHRRSQMIPFFIWGHWDPRIKVNTKIMREKKNERNLRKPQTVVHADWSSSNLQSKRKCLTRFSNNKVKRIVQLKQTKCEENVQIFDGGIGWF